MTLIMKNTHKKIIYKAHNSVKVKINFTIYCLFFIFIAVDNVFLSFFILLYFPVVSEGAFSSQLFLHIYKFIYK